MTIQTDGINKDSYGNKEIQEGRLVYAADTASSDTYVVTLQPAATEYVTGMTINFLATTANTGASTLNVNGLGAKNILKNHDQTLADGDIEAAQVVTVVYDGTQFQMQSQTGTALETGDLGANVATFLATPSSSNLAEAVTDETGTGALVFATSPALAAYKTIYIPASAMAPTVTNGANGGTYEYTTQDIQYDYMAFDGATEQFACFQFPAPEDWNLGTIKAKFFWSSATGSTANDTVEWELQGGAVTNSDAIDTALGTSQVISDVLLADNGGDMQLTGATPAITIAGTPAAGDLLVFKVSRNVGGTDDMTENAWLFGVWIQYLTSVAPATW